MFWQPAEIYRFFMSFFHSTTDILPTSLFDRIDHSEQFIRIGTLVVCLDVNE